MRLVVLFATDRALGACPLSSEPEQQIPKEARALIVPATIQAVIDEFEATQAPCNVHQIQAALSNARSALITPSDPENMGAWAEVLAFSLVPNRIHESPWSTYFGPVGSGTDKEGKTVYFPDISHADVNVLLHWTERAKAIVHPVLKARYADLSWDFCPLIGKVRRDPEMARNAIDSYLTSVASSLRLELHDRFDAALRAFDLAIMIRDAERTNSARGALLELHRGVIDSNGPQWWFTFDRLIDERNGGVTDAERQQLVDDLEILVLRFGKTDDPKAFDPHALEAAAKRLIKHYVRLRQRDDIRRLHLAIGRAFEHFASLGDAMLASAVLQTAVNSFRDAGVPDESKRVRRLMEDKIAQSRELMKPIQTMFEIPHDDMEAFLKAVVLDDLGSTFLRIAVEFLASRKEAEEAVRKTVETAPLLAHLTQSIIADDHVAAKIGSVDDDPFGRLIQQANQRLSADSVWLRAAFERAFDRHLITVEHIVSWANRHGLFDDVTFLIQGVHAWLENDFVKAAHVLVPQVEHGLRTITGQLGMAVTKAHGTVPGVGVAIGMGDILYSEEITEKLGPDLTLYFLAIYADPRGMNLRNKIAHGLLKPGAATGTLVRLLIHTLMVFGVWKELAERRR